MRKQWVIYFATAMLAGGAGGAMLAPAPVGAVAREIVELQQSVQQVMQEQKDLQTAITQENAVQKTLIELSLDSVNKPQRNHGRGANFRPRNARQFGRSFGHTMSTQVQGLSDNMQEMMASDGQTQPAAH